MVRRVIGRERLALAGVEPCGGTWLDEMAGLVDWSELDRLRAGDLVNCSVMAGSLPGRLSLALSNATNALDVLAQQIQASSIEVARSSSFTTGSRRSTASLRKFSRLSPVRGSASATDRCVSAISRA